METIRKYDAVIFGADLFQLKKAVQLAEEGKKVLVLTKSNVPGGEYVSFRRGTFEFVPGSSAEPDGFPGAVRGTEGQTAALACEKKLRELGGEVWYKADVRRIVLDERNQPVIEVNSGLKVTAEQMEDLFFQPELYYLHGKLTAKVLLALDLPYGQLKAAAAGYGRAEVFAADGTEDRCVLRLSGEVSEELFRTVSEENYFRIKDSIAAEILEAFEKASGLIIRDRILEADAVTPLSLSRQLVCAPAAEPEWARLGDVLHPGIQFGRVEKVVDRGHARSFTIGPDPERGTESLAYFRAGQYVSIMQPVGEAIVCKPYSICSSPKDALGKEHTTYTVMIERNPEGFFSPHALDTWEPGTKLTLSGPLGFAYHLPLRDAPRVVALAGSSGVTPFYAMAAAIADRIEDFDLTILYGSRTADTILLRDELDEIVRRSGGKVKVVHVLSDEQLDGYEYGFITPELIRKYAPEGDYSIFICGPAAMYDYLHRELPKLGLPEGRIRFELPGEFGDPALDPVYPREAAGKTFRLAVRERGNERTLSCRSDQTLMQAIERAGIVIEADCRSGQCGWCRSMLLSGEVFVPKSRDGRRSGEAGFGWVHPCVTYPLSDVVLEIWNH